LKTLVNRVAGPLGVSNGRNRRCGEGPALRVRRRARLGLDQGQDASGNASIRNCMKAFTLLLTNFCEVWRTQTSA
jgi:hypothetical protein